MAIPKVNKSLADFEKSILGLSILGGIAAVVGCFMFLLAKPFESSGQLQATFGTGLFLLGSGLLGIAILGSLLRITATSIIEGLGGNILVKIPNAGSNNHHRARQDQNGQASSEPEALPEASNLGQPKFVVWDPSDKLIPESQIDDGKNKRN